MPRRYIFEFIGTYNITSPLDAITIELPLPIQDLVITAESPNAKGDYYLAGYFNLIARHDELPVDTELFNGKLPLGSKMVSISQYLNDCDRMFLQLSRVDYLYSMNFSIYGNILFPETNPPYLDEGVF